MRKNKTHHRLVGGIDHLSLDARSFLPSHEDIQYVCRFFALEKVLTFQREKNVALSHSNFFVFVSTTRGNFAFKFYPATSKKNILHEYILNRHLLLNGFPTPAMLTSPDGQTSTLSCGRLATCFEFINGQQAWQHIHKKTVQVKITDHIRQLKTVLNTLAGSKFIQSQLSFPFQIKDLIQTASGLTPFEHDKYIYSELQHIAQAYNIYKKLFLRQVIHNNLTLTNILISKGNAVVLDLSHVKEDYLLSDLTALILSCHFLKISPKIIQGLTEQYFNVHDLKKPYRSVLNIQLRLTVIREFLKYTARQKNQSKKCELPPGRIKTYNYYLAERTKHLANLLQQLYLGSCKF